MDKDEKIEALRTAIAAVRDQQNRLENPNQNELIQRKQEELEHHFSILMKMEHELVQSNRGD